MLEPDFEQARRYALHRLEHELDPALCYHSVAHTRDEVVPAVDRLAAREGVQGDQLLLLRTAAYFHDIGFIERREGHEAAGARIAAAILPQFSYGQAHIEAIAQMILATRLPQAPADLPAAILADSDLDMLGRSDFLALNQLLRVELGAFAGPIGDREWYSQQVDFVRAHRYWTPAARTLRDRGKARNLRALEELLAAAAAPTPTQR